MIGTYRGILTDKNVSPNVKRIVLQERAGIKLSDKQKQTLKRELNKEKKKQAHNKKYDVEDKE